MKKQYFPKLKDREWLYEQYVINQRTYLDIASEIGCSKYSVYHAIKRLEIPSREHSSKYPQLNDKEWLRSMYEIKHLSTRQIAELLGTSIGNVASHLTTMGVKLRSSKEGLAVRYPNGRKGEETSNWRGGITEANALERGSRQYDLWRRAILERDDYTCQMCGKRGGELHADHIKSFAYYPELRYSLDNGRTLCIPCHKTTDTYRRPRKKNDPSFGIE